MDDGIVGNDEAGLSIYEAYKGKQIKRKRDNFIGEIINVDIEKGQLTVRALNGQRKGEEISFVLSVIMSDMYEVI